MRRLNIVIYGIERAGKPSKRQLSHCRLTDELRRRDLQRSSLQLMEPPDCLDSGGMLEIKSTQQEGGQGFDHARKRCVCASSRAILAASLDLILTSI